jgi:hypothetical protein
MNPVKREKTNKEMSDNALALGVIAFSGVLALLALYSDIDNDRAQTALAVASNGMSGVIGFIGGKARKSSTEEEN